MSAIYNEIEPYACDWLENLAAKGHIAHGRVERRSIKDLGPGDVAGDGQRHFFAGIGVWSYALRLAGVPDELSVWTGSCPCQPFSAAGRRGGVDDERHLWPEWFRLIRECRPAVVFGEQVASADGLGWLDVVSADLEGAGYTVGAADLCAAGVGAPHIRQRLYFAAFRPEGIPALRLAYDNNKGLGLVGRDVPEDRNPQPGNDADGRGEACGVADPTGRRLASRSFGEAPRKAEGGGERSLGTHVHSATRELGDTGGEGSQGRGERRDSSDQRAFGSSGLARATGDFWGAADWIPCRDGKLRPVEPGSFPLAHGAPARVGRLRAYGNAIVPQVAATFIRAALQAVSP